MAPSRYTGAAQSSTVSSAYARGGSVSKTRRPSGIKSVGSGGSKLADGEVAEQVEIEDFRPPEWRTVLNRRADLGYPDFYPSRPGFGQAEDILTEEKVKNGFSAKAFVAVGAESFSMHGPIHQHLLGGGLEMLNKLGEEIAQKRDEGMPQIGERIFRIPVRVTYNDTKRLQFLSDLANPNLPLHRLMRNPVPHGFKGIELLDTMFSPTGPANRAPMAKLPPDPIPIDRALWFIRVLGANEITAHRGRAAPIVPSAPSPAAATPSSTNTAPATPALPVSSNDWYSQEFTNVFTAWMRIQLGQLVLPAKTKAVVPAKGPVGVLGDEKARTRWLAKWEYSTTLLRELHSRRLISNRTFLGWLADYLSLANLAQVGFIAQLIADYLPDMARHVWIGRLCLRAVCDKIQDIRGATLDSLAKVESMLVHIVTALVEADQEVLLSPNVWRHQGVLESMLKPDIVGDAAWVELAARNNVLLFKATSTESNSSPRRHQMEEIHKLDSISDETDMTKLCKSFFDGSSSPTSPSLDPKRLEEKIFILLNWAMGLYQLGIHRPYGVYTLLKMWSEQRYEYVATASAPTPPVDLFPHLYNWLDNSVAAKKESNVQAIGITFGEFTRQGLFSYGRYLQALIARGHTARSRPNGPVSHHLALLSAMPIFVQAKDLLQQRRIALSGDDMEQRRADEAAETAALQAFKDEVEEYIPEIFDNHDRDPMRDEVDHQMESTRGISRHIFLQARFVVFPAAERHLKKRGRTPAMDASAFARVIQVFRLCWGYSTIADLIIKATKLSDDEEILRMVIDAVRRDADVWTAMDRWPMIADALMERHSRLERKRRFSPALSALLLELANKGRLNEEDAADVRAMAEEQSATQESDGVDFKESIDSLRKSLGATESAAAFASKLFAKHGTFTKWSEQWWAVIAESIQNRNLDAIVAHVNHVCDLAATSLDAPVAAWLNGLNPSNRIEVIRGTYRLLLRLVTQRRLSTILLVNSLILPTWKHAASSLPLSNPHQHALEATIVLAQQLLLTNPPQKHLPPTSLQESFIAQTSRAEVFHNRNVLNLIRHLPFLVVLQASRVADRIKEEIGELLQCLGMTPSFKTAAFRHLDLLKDTFLSSEWSKMPYDPAVEAGMIDTLKAIMSEGTSKTTLPALGNGARFSAWRWTRIVLEMRVEFKRLAMRIENNNEPAEARDTLRRLVQSSLDRDISADDADLLCETFRGIEPVVMQEILAVGFDRLGALLSHAVGADDSSLVQADAKAIDLLLRILDGSRSANSDASLLAARHRLLDLIAVALQAVERQISDDEPTTEPGHVLNIVLKLLRFVLGWAVNDAPPRPDIGRLAVAYLRVMAVSPLPPDMLVYIVDSAPPASRAGVYTALLSETASSAVQKVLFQAPSVMPYSCSKRHASLSTNADDTVLPLDDRHWELFEHMFPLPLARPHGEQFLTSRPVPDTSSIPLPLFNPQINRDALPSESTYEADDAGFTWEDYASERNLGDGLAGEPLSAKLVATNLYAGYDEATVETELHSPLATQAALDAASPSTSISAASFVTRPRRMSTRLAAGTGIKAPTGSNRDPILVDEDEESSEDDLEIIEAAPAKRPRVGGKTTAGAGAGSRATTGGKAPARKTTAGKTVSRKATKSVKSTGGKAPTKGGGRRKSVQD